MKKKLDSKVNRQKKSMVIVVSVLMGLFVVCFATHFLYGAIQKSSKIKTGDFVYAESLEHLVKNDWMGEWIWEEKSKANTHVAFRKSFNLQSQQTSDIEALISADSKCTMWLNGQLIVVDGSLKRGPTPTDSYYQKVTLPASAFIQGENTLAILVWYFGKNGYAHVDSGHGGFLFECEVQGQKIFSNSTFKAKRMDSFVDDGFRFFSQPNYRLAESNIYYDARKGNFDFVKVDFDDSSWKNASSFGKGGVSPWNKLYLSSTTTPLFSDIKSFINGNEFINHTFKKRTTIELDIGKSIQFNPYIRLKAESGKKIRFLTDTFRDNHERGYDNIYITSGGEQQFECVYWMSGSKLVLTIPKGVTLLDAGYRVVGYENQPLAGAFSCDDVALNTLWQKSATSLIVNMNDTYMDCPDRERAQWLGDGVVSAKTAHYLFGDASYGLSQKLYTSLVGWTKKDGVFATVAPNGIELFELPCQNLAAIVSMYDYYMYSGDKQTLSLLYPLMQKYLSLWEQDGIVTHRNGSWDWGDWGTKIDMPVLENAWYYYALTTLQKTALLFDDVPTYEWATAKANTLYEAYNNRFWSGRGYTSNQQYDDRGNAIALISGLASVDKYDALVEVLTNTQNASPYMEKYVDEALFKAGRGDLALERMKLRYKDMIESSYTTLWELWNPVTGGVNHAWGGGSVILFAEYFAGIKYTGAGYSQYTIEPNISLSHTLATKVSTPRGEIALNYAKTHNALTINIVAPTGGTIILPSNNLTLTINGTTVYANNTYIANDICSSFSNNAGQVIVNI